MDEYLKKLKGNISTGIGQMMGSNTSEQTSKVKIGQPKPVVSTQPKSVVTSNPSAVTPTIVNPTPIKKPIVSSTPKDAYIKSLTSTTPTVSSSVNTQTTSSQPVTLQVPQTSPQRSSAMDSYIQSYKTYQEALKNNEKEKQAQEAYNTAQAEVSKAIAGREGRGLGISTGIVRGEQEKLLRQTQPELARLQKQVELEQGVQKGAVEAAKTDVEFQKELIGTEKPIEVGGVLYSKQADGSYKPLTTPTSKAPTTMETTQGIMQYNTETGKWEPTGFQKPKSATGDSLTPYQQFQATQSISKDTATRTENAREIARQSGIMNQAYSSFTSGGDKNIATQAIIATFNKILDPTSVVRESEYDRTAAGQSLLARIQGKYDNITQGGSSVTPETLKAAVDLADQYMKNAQKSIVKENERAKLMASNFGLNPDFVTSGSYQPEPEAPTNDFSDVESSISIEGKNAYLPRSVWATLGARKDALIAEAKADGYTLLVRD